jgi:hypothetical protein
MYINDFRAGQHQRARLSPWDWRSREVADSHSRTSKIKARRRGDVFGATLRVLIVGRGLLLAFWAVAVLALCLIIAAGFACG